MCQVANSTPWGRSGRAPTCGHKNGRSATPGRRSATGLIFTLLNSVTLRLLSFMCQGRISKHSAARRRATRKLRPAAHCGRYAPTAASPPTPKPSRPNWAQLLFSTLRSKPHQCRVMAPYHINDGQRVYYWRENG